MRPAELRGQQGGDLLTDNRRLTAEIPRRRERRPIPDRSPPQEWRRRYRTASRLRLPPDGTGRASFCDVVLRGAFIGEWASRSRRGRHKYRFTGRAAAGVDSCTSVFVVFKTEQAHQLPCGTVREKTSDASCPQKRC